MTDWTDQLRPASWRGLPFAVRTAESHFGRRQAVHEYPYRDTPWVEDMGRATRRIGFSAFIVSDSAIYKGGEVIAQREQLVAAAETKGPGKLVHPTLGDLMVSLLNMSVIERWDEGRYFELTFTFIEYGDRIFPRPETATPEKVKEGGLEAKLKAAEAFAQEVKATLTKGFVTVQKALSTARQWTDRIVHFGQDATGMFRLTALLTGSFGRYFQGAVSGLAGRFGISTSTAIKTSADLILAGATRRAELAALGDAVTLAIEGLGQTSTSDDVAAAVQDQVDTLASNCVDPADAVRLMEDLAAFLPTGPAPASDIGLALGALYRRAAVTAMAEASARYQPSSYDDAHALLLRVTAALDTEITVAGDQGADPAWDSLRALRTAVVRDLRKRGADLSPITRVTTAEPMPVLALAQRLYRDPDRAEELMIRANPIHPLFMPVEFEALAR